MRRGVSLRGGQTKTSEALETVAAGDGTIKFTRDESGANVSSRSRSESSVVFGMINSSFMLIPPIGTNKGVTTNAKRWAKNSEEPKTANKLVTRPSPSKSRMPAVTKGCLMEVRGAHYPLT